MHSACALTVLVLIATITAQQPRTATLRGEVRGCGDRRPRVTLFHSDGHRGTVEAVAEVRGEPGGHFELPDLPWFEGYDWDYNWAILVARVGNRVGMLQIRSDVDPAALAIELRPTRTLRGVLRDEVSGQPIAGAWVWAMIFGSPGIVGTVWPTAPMVPWSVRTDADGRFEMRGVPEYASYVLVAGGPDHGRRQLRVTDPSAPITATLVAAGRITGRVLLPDGGPARDIEIWADGDHDGFARARTDDDGCFVIPSLAGETFRLWAKWPGHPGILAHGVVVTAGDTAAVELQLAATAVVTGRLVHDATGESFVPFGRTYVTAWGNERDGRQAVLTVPVAADGTFRLRAPVGAVRLVVGATGVVNVGDARVTAVAGEAVEVEVRVRSSKPR